MGGLCAGVGVGASLGAARLRGFRQNGASRARELCGKYVCVGHEGAYEVLRSGAAHSRWEKREGGRPNFFLQFVRRGGAAAAIFF